MSINSEMTNLADAIRAKSGVSGKLTITEMTDAVEGIEINQGSDIDFTGVNVTSNKMLAGTVAINASGTKVSGTIQTVTATLSGNVTTVPAGYIAEKQTLTVTEAAAPTTSGNVVTINKGYHSAQKKITVGTTKAAATYTPSTADQSIAAGTYLSGKQTIKGDANLTAENIKSGVRIFAVTGTFEGSGGGGGGSGGSGTFDLAKVTNYTPYAPAMTAVTAVSVSGMGSFGDEEDFSAANGWYYVTPETAGETDWKKRIYKHESEDYYLFYYVDPEYSEDAYWQFGYDTDSGFLTLYSTENISSGVNDWENWDWGETFTLTTNVTETSIPETQMVLKGVLATGYADGEWSFGTAEKSFAGFEYMPSVGNLYATNGDTLIGMSIGMPGGIMYLRFRIDKIRGNWEGVQFSEFLLFDKDDNPIFLNTLGVAEVSADAKNSSPSGEGPEKAFDGEVSNGSSKWCSMPFNNPSWVQVRFRQPVVIADYPQYGWYTANDSTGRDPVSWSVLVSTDDVTWTPISVVDNYATPTARGVLAGKWEF